MLSYCLERNWVDDSFFKEKIKGADSSNSRPRSNHYGDSSLG